MMRRSIVTALLILAMVATRAIAQPIDPIPVTVVSVTDGDTIRVLLPDGTIEPIRLIGMDTPETVDPGSPVQCYGPEASARAKELAEGKAVQLELDVEQRDRFGRLLSYVWLTGDDGSLWMLNERMAAEGYAIQLTIQPNSKYADRFAAAVQSARDQGLGMWSTCFAIPSPDPLAIQAPPANEGPPPAEQITPALPAPPPPPPTATTAPAKPTGNCDPSYPSVCIPPFPPDLDCPQVPHRNFAVRPPDPHRFDADRDGIGCET